MQAVKERPVGFAEREGFSSYVGFTPPSTPAVVETTVTLRPNANGNQTDWNQYYTGAPGDYYNQVNEAIPDENTSFVGCAYPYSAVLALFQLDALPAGVLAISSVKVGWRCRKTHAIGSGYVNIGLRTYTVSYYAGGNQFQLTDYANYEASWAVNPNTGLAWTVAEVNALQAQIRGYPGSYRIYCTQVYAEVTYTYTP